MEYCVVQSGLIVNMIVCENAQLAAQFGAVPSYEGARIGSKYTPPKEPTVEEIMDAMLGFNELVEKGNGGVTFLNVLPALLWEVAA